MSAPLLAVPNVSEGRRPEVVDRIGAGFVSAGAALLDTHSDGDHNRSVLTLAGTPSALTDGLLAGAREALALIDMRHHEGLHPAVGALDVCPLVGPGEEAMEIAREHVPVLGERLAGELAIPVFIYGVLATSPERAERHHFRRGGLEELTRRMREAELEPDFGPPQPHPSGGAILVAARRPLAAFNFELDTPGGAVAEAIAAELRERGGGPPGVRAVGLALSSGRAQVSTNVNDPVAVPLARLLDLVERLAGRHGARIVEAELVGLLPAAAVAEWPHERIPIRGFDPDRSLIETRLASL